MAFESKTFCIKVQLNSLILFLIKILLSAISSYFEKTTTMVYMHIVNKIIISFISNRLLLNDVFSEVEGQIMEALTK